MTCKSFSNIASVALLSCGISMVAFSPVHADQSSAFTIERAKDGYEAAKKKWQEDRDRVAAGIRETEKLIAEREQLEKEANEAWIAANRQIEEAEQKASSDAKDGDQSEQALEARYQALDKEHNALASKEGRLLDLYARGKANRVQRIRAERVLAKLKQLSSEKIKVGEEKFALIIENSDTRQRNSSRVYDLRINRPSQFEVNRIQRQFQAAMENRMRVPDEFELKEDEDKVHEAGMRYLSALLAAPPIHVASVEASLNGKLVYKAAYEDATGRRQGVSGDERDALDANIAKLTEQRDAIQKQMRKFERDRKRIREEWERAYDDYVIHTEAISDNEIRLLVFNFAVEATAVTVGAVLTGGVAVPAMYGAGEIFSKSMKPTARKAAADMTGIMADVFKRIGEGAGNVKLIQQTMDATAEAIGHISADSRGKLVNELVDAGFKVGEVYGAKKTAGELTARDVDVLTAVGVDRWKDVVASDAIELVLADGANVATVVAGRAILPGVSYSSAAKSVGLALATTATKAGATAITDSIRESHIYWYKFALAEAAAAQHAYSIASITFRGLRAEATHLSQKIEALQTLRNTGRAPKRLNVSVNEILDAEEVENPGSLDIRIRFSQQLEKAPKFSAAGVTFGRPERVVEDGREWLIDVRDVVNAQDLASIPLSITLDDEELPYRRLDSDPTTTPKLASLSVDGWNNFEKGTDTKHILRLKPVEEETEEQTSDAPVEASLDTVSIQGLWRFDDGETWRIETQGGLAIVQPKRINVRALQNEIDELEAEIKNFKRKHRVYIWRSFDNPLDFLEHTRIRNVDRETYEYVGEDIASDKKARLEKMEELVGSKKAKLAEIAEEKSADRVAFEDLRSGAGTSVRITVNRKGCVFIIDTAFFDGETLGYDTTLDRTCRFNEALPASIKQQLMAGGYPRNVMGMLKLKQHPVSKEQILDGRFWTRQIHYSGSQINRVTALIEKNPERAVRVTSENVVSTTDDAQ
ncbi:MAG: hypothetical protein AAGE61_05760 [Pseudomonadota bacterium]